MTVTVDVCRILSDHVYNDSQKKVNLPLGWNIISVTGIDEALNFERSYWIKDENGLGKKLFFTSNSGCQAAFYYNETTNEGVIAYRGTEPINEPIQDIVQTDLLFIWGGIPQQYYNAIEFYDAVIAKYSNATIYLTGHSLGGGLAQLVCAYALNKVVLRKTHQTYTFNAPGAHKIAKNLGYRTDMAYPITNYSVMNDWCGMVNSHLGELYVFPPVEMKSDPLTDTHCAILEFDFSKTKSFLKPAGFNESEGVSLWYYDVNNYYGRAFEIGAQIGYKARMIINALKKYTAGIKVQSLQNAISILRSNPQFIQHEFRYKTPNKTYILGLPEEQNGIFGTNKNDIIYGGYEKDVLAGGSGNDTIIGDEGNDTLYGDYGNDSLLGGEGMDTLYGGSNNDILYGGPGKDYLSGGAGHDLYILEKYSLDTIGDSDGKGIIKYDGYFLLGTARKIEENKWINARNIVYEYRAPNLIVDNSFTIQQFKNYNFGIILLKEDGSPEPSIPGSSGGSGEGGEGSGSGSGSGGGGGEGGSNASGTGESNFDHDDDGNLIDTPIYGGSDNDEYTIMDGDTIWGIGQRFGIDMEEILRLNPWLYDRMTDDGKILIYPGEILILPPGCLLLPIEDNPSFEGFGPLAYGNASSDIKKANNSNHLLAPLTL